MIERLITFLSVLSSMFTVLFFVLLYAMHQGYDPGPFLRGEFGQASTPKVETVAPNIEPIASPKVSTTTATDTTAKMAATSSKVAPTPKPSPPVVKKPAKTDPKILAPAPLIVEKKSPPPTPSPTPIATPSSASSSEPGVPSSDGALNQKQILDIVNQERTKAGLLPLGFNIRLSAMAEGKVVDMINKQYFAHVSPLGIDVAALSKIYGYEYIFLGENLAMGDFVSSSDVMTGWMNSPGHRANILNKNYTEVGISALQGNYQGRVVWYAVQEFGKPLSLCPSPNATLEAKIAKEEQQVSDSERSLSALRATIEQSSGGDQSAYNTLVEQYNALVDQYNVLVATTKADIAAFNASVTAFNACIGSSSTSTPPTE